MTARDGRTSSPEWELQEPSLSKPRTTWSITDKHDEIHKTTLHCRQRRTQQRPQATRTENFAKCGHVILQMFERAEVQTCSSQYRRRSHYNSIHNAAAMRCAVIMAALWNRAGHYSFVLWFLLLSIFYLFSSSNLSGRRLDVYHTSTHGVALARIYIAGLKCCLLYTSPSPRD